MDKSELTPIQQEIAKALEQLSGKSLFTEFILAKKIRENTKLDGKKKAGIGLADLEKALSFIEENNQIFFALHLNQVNDLLIEKSETSIPLTQEAHHRRIRSEKSMSIFTSGDLVKTKTGKKPKEKSFKGRDFYDED